MCGCSKKSGVRNVGKRPIVTPATKSVSKGIPATSQKIGLLKQNDQSHLSRQKRELERKRRLLTKSTPRNS